MGRIEDNGAFRPYREWTDTQLFEEYHRNESGSYWPFAITALLIMTVWKLYGTWYGWPLLIGSVAFVIIMIVAIRNDSVPPRQTELRKELERRLR